MASAASSSVTSWPASSSRRAAMRPAGPPPHTAMRAAAVGGAAGIPGILPAAPRLYNPAAPTARHAARARRVREALPEARDEAPAPALAGRVARRARALGLRARVHG